MGTREKIINKLQSIKNFVVFAVIMFLLVVVYFKNNRINNLETKLLSKPQIEFVYQNIVDTFTDSIPYPVEIVKWKTKTVRDTLPIPTELNFGDSARIAEAYNNLYNQYANITLYDDILKDDTLAFIRLTEKTQYNKIFDRNLIYEDRTPIVKITTTIPDSKWSVIGGLSGNFDNIYVGTGIVTRKNAVYTINYDLFNKGYSASFYLPIFNF